MVLLLTVALVTCIAACSRRNDDLRVVLITLDTLRHDSFAGNATTMPRLRQWAERATVFDRFYAATASTQPTHASMFTGLHPWQHGVARNGMQLAEGYPTVVEQLRDAGFATAATVASFPVSERFGFGQGFERFHDDFVNGAVTTTEWLNAARRVEAKEGASVTQLGDPFYALADSVTATALAQLDAATARRQFFWFHFFDPHSPYGDTTGEAPTNPYKVLKLAAKGEDPVPALAHARRLYDADVSYLDAALGRLLERLEADASRFETHVVIVSDHGESFGEAGSMAHGRRLISSQLHVPCIIRSPLLEVGVRGDVVSSIDIAATLLALAGMEEGPPREAFPDSSRDLTQPPGRAPRAFGMRRTYEKPFKDRRLDGSVHEIAGYLFYFLDADGELFRGTGDALMPPAAGSELSPEEAKRLRSLFEGFERQLTRNQAEVDLDPEAAERLRALGYVD